MQPNPTDERILILDFGGQYTRLIARRIRECHVYCEIAPPDVRAATIADAGLRGVVLSGGPSSAYECGALDVDPAVFDLGVPVLGICYGLHLIAKRFRGEIRPAEAREYGRTELRVTGPDPLLDGLGTSLSCWMSHGDSVVQAPEGFVVSAATENTPVAAMLEPSRRIHGVQFHPEVAHTPFGAELLRRFVIDVCGCEGLWTSQSYIAEAVQWVREQVCEAGVVCGVSGGVDSCAVAALVHRAVGEQLTCIFVDHGLLRQGEAEQVQRDFADALGLRLIAVNAGDRFLGALAGVVDPEHKRRIIGEQFVRVFEETAENLHGVQFLAQGTLYPDVIESGTGTAAKIKTHHNVGGLPERMRLKVIEPIRYLFKDEVRAVAADLGLPESIVWRHPFPGPGLAVRITGEVTLERLSILRAADAIFIDELRRAGLYRQVWQAFAALLAGVRSVGVMGDGRTYWHPVVLRAVTSDDAMTAHWSHIPYDVLERVSNRIVNEVPGVNRVVYDISTKPPATIEWE